MDLTPVERQRLNDLLDQLIAATEGRVFWLNRVRETSVELRELMSEWLAPDVTDGASVEDTAPEGGAPSAHCE